MLKASLSGSPGFYIGYTLEHGELACLRQMIGRRDLRHEHIKHKKHRLFDADEVKHVKTFKFLEQIRQELGEFTISDVCYGDTHEKGREEVYFRVVRPNEIEDVGPLHRDSDFHKSMPSLHEHDKCTIKIWIPIESEPGLNGLLVVHDSHISDNHKANLLSLAPGQIVLFNDRLLHGGSLNRGRHNRISVEITLGFQHEIYV